MTYEQFMAQVRRTDPERHAALAARYPVIGDGSPSWRTIQQHEFSAGLFRNDDDELIFDRVVAMTQGQP